jgi:antibiotic biosynthesis monooxygenase (ABM) superfamily enzyme
MTWWRVRPGNEAEFLATARRLADVLLALPNPPGGLTLVQSTDDEAVFETIGWFHSQQDLQAMRDNDDARALLERLVGLCSEFRPTAHRVVYATAALGL